MVFHATCYLRLRAERAVYAVVVAYDVTLCQTPPRARFLITVDAMPMLFFHCFRLRFATLRFSPPGYASRDAVTICRHVTDCHFRLIDVYCYASIRFSCRHADYAAIR